MKRLAALLRPSPAELRALAERETDPRFAAEFEQLCPGPLLTVLALAGIGALAVVTAPVRIAAGLLAGRRR
ncbi:MAG TPA: hypothetical protein VK665_08255 [Candidatus Elarobacter sp.]|nr:hypothetical protein [Candidatus Elarobacter sp.]